MSNLSLSDAFFQAVILSIRQNSFSAGTPPRTPLGELLRRSPKPSSRLGRGTPLPITFPIDAFGVSISAPTRLHCHAPKFPNTYSWLRLWQWLLFQSRHINTVLLLLLLYLTAKYYRPGTGVRCFIDTQQMLLRFYSPGSSTFLYEMTSWPPFGN